MHAPGRRSRPRDRTSRAASISRPAVVEPTGDLLLRFGSAAAETPLQLLHRRRLEEDQDGVGDHARGSGSAPWTSISRRTSLPGASLLLDVAPRCSRASARTIGAHSRSLAVVDHPIELVRRTRRSSRRPRPPTARGARVVARDGQDQPLVDRGRARSRTTRSLADPGGTGDDEERCPARAKRYFANLASSSSRCLAPRPRTRRLARDVELLHDLLRAHLADTGERLEHDRHLHLADGVVARRVSTSLSVRLPGLQLALQLGASLARGGGLFERPLRCSGVRVGRAMSRSFASSIVRGGEEPGEYTHGPRRATNLRNRPRPAVSHRGHERRRAQRDAEQDAARHPDRIVGRR